MALLTPAVQGGCSTWSLAVTATHAIVCYADHLKMPARIRAGDGTFDTFLSKFITINRSGLGYVSCQELAAYLSSLTVNTRSSSGGVAASRVATAVGH